MQPKVITSNKKYQSSNNHNKSTEKYSQAKLQNTRKVNLIIFLHIWVITTMISRRAAIIFVLPLTFGA